ALDVQGLQAPNRVSEDVRGLPRAGDGRREFRSIRRSAAAAAAHHRRLSARARGRRGGLTANTNAVVRVTIRPFALHCYARRSSSFDGCARTKPVNQDRDRKQNNAKKQICRWQGDEKRPKP